MYDSEFDYPYDETPLGQRLRWSWAMMISHSAYNEGRYQAARLEMRLAAAAYAFYRGWNVSYTSPRIYRNIM